MRVLVVSDTHGLLRPEVLALARQADTVLHAGDLGKIEVLTALREAATGPVHAVRGNVDRTLPLCDLPETLLVELEGVGIYVLHDLNDLGLSPVAAGLRVVISGHTHQPRLEERDGVTYLNPGSVGPRRFSLPGGVRVAASGGGGRGSGGAADVGVGVLVGGAGGSLLA